MSYTSLAVKDVNNLSSDRFIKIFGNVVEHYPAAAIGILKNRPFSNSQDICNAIGVYIDGLPLSEKEKILELHPDLAGKLADLGKLTVESSEEQISAGLDKLSTEEKQQLNEFNQKYKTKFDFPFVICARENKAATIFSAIQKRLNNNKPQEIENGINEVKKISALRIAQIVKD